MALMKVKQESIKMETKKEFSIQKRDVSVSQNPLNEKKDFVIIKKIAKHGSQAIIVIPRVLESSLKPGTIVEIKLNILEEKGGEND